MACASAREPETLHQPVPPAVTATRPAVDLDAISLVLLDRPQGFAFDGSTAEWGSLAPVAEQATEEPIPRPRAPAAFVHPEADETGPELSAPPRGPAGSQLALTLDGAGMLITGRLIGTAARGFQLRVTSASPTLPSIGNQSMPSGVAAGFDCKNSWTWGNDGEVLPGPPLDPEVASQCLHQEQKGIAFATAFYRSLTRTIVVPVDQPRVFAPGGQPIPGEAQWLRSGSEWHVEVKLPLSELPDLTEAPLRVIGVAAAAVGTSDAAMPAPSWLTLPTALTLSPFEDLRELAFTPGSTRQHTFDWFYAPCVTYHPATPSDVRFVRHTDDSATELVQHRVPLYEPIKQFGDVEVGFMAAPTSTIVVRKAGGSPVLMSPSTLGFAGLELPFQRRWAGERDGEFHVLSFLPQDLTTASLPLVAQWWLVRIRRDGSVEETLLSPTTPTPGFYSFAEHSETMNPDASRLEVVGVPNGMTIGAGKALKTVWTWNPTTHLYDEKATTVPWPRKAK